MAEYIVFASVIISLLSIAVALVRFMKGPSVLDRVVAFDVIGIISMGIIAVLAHLLGRVIYVDVALVYGLLSFLGVLTVARFYERGL